MNETLNAKHGTFVGTESCTHEHFHAVIGGMSLQIQDVVLLFVDIPHPVEGTVIIMMNWIEALIHDAKCVIPNNTLSSTCGENAFTSPNHIRMV